MKASKKNSWATVKTHHDLPADQVISALQKEIRRGHTENAAFLAYEMILSGGELEEYLWRRLMVISVEDVGFGEPMAPVLVNALHQTFDRLGVESPDRTLLAIHAVRYLCRSKKDRSSDEMALWVRLSVEQNEKAPEIPDYALDMHTYEGKLRGRDLRHFLEIGAVVDPEDRDRDTTYRDRIMEILEGSDE